MWSSRLFWRIFVAYGALYVLLAVLYAAVLAHQQRELLMQKVRERLRSEAVLMASLVARSPDEQPWSSLQTLVAQLAQKTQSRVTIVDHDGTVHADSHEDPLHMGFHGDRPEIRAAAEHGAGESVRQSTTQGKRVYYYAIAMPGGDHPPGFVRISLALGSLDGEVATLNRQLLAITLGVGAIFVPLSYIVVGRIIRPLSQITASISAISAGDYSSRVKLAGKDEPTQLAMALNAMQDQLQQRVGELQESSDRMATVLSGMIEGVIAVDTQRRVLLANAASRSLLDVNTKDVVGRPLLEVIRNRDVHEIVMAALSGTQPITREITLAGGQRRAVKLLAARLPGTPSPGVVIVLHDVTELRRLENLRRDFVANVSHELKTPLSSIKAYAETLRLGAIDDPEHNRRFVERIEDQANRLHDLILDVLHLARVEAGQEAFEFTDVSLRDAVDECIARHADAAATAGIHLTVKPDSENLRVYVDAGGLQTILDNLVTNAITYTASGGRVTLEWRRAGSFAELDVVDTGVGIALQDQARVFERFYRVDRARSRERGSTGLGLSIVKHLSQAFGGDVGLTSELGRGSTFRVRLPLKAL